MPDALKVVIFTLSSFGVLFVLSKILGKKQVAQLDFVDYVIGISIGSIAAEMSTNTTDPFYHYLIAMAGFFLLDLVINYLGKKGAFLKTVFKGKPLVIIYEGKIDYKNLKKSRLDINDLLSLCRELNYFDTNDIFYALFETSGKLSIIPKAEQRPTVASDLNIPLQPASLPNYLVCDGKISFSGLSDLGKDESWLLKKLGLKSKKELKQIILAVYDEKTQSINSHYKN